MTLSFCLYIIFGILWVLLPHTQKTFDKYREMAIVEMIKTGDIKEGEIGNEYIRALDITISLAIFMTVLFWPISMFSFFKNYFTR